MADNTKTALQKALADLERLKKQAGVDLDALGAKAVEQFKKQHAQYADLITQTEADALATKKKYEFIEKQIEAAEKVLETTRLIKLAEGESRDLHKEKVKDAEDWLSILEDSRKKLEKTAKGAEKVASAFDKTNSIADDLNARLFGITEKTEEWKDAIEGAGGGLTGVAKILGGVGKRLGKNADSSLQFAKVIEKSGEMMRESMDKMMQAIDQTAEKYSFFGSLAKGFEFEDQFRMMGREASLLTVNEMEDVFKKRGPRVADGLNLAISEVNQSIVQLKSSFASFRDTSTQVQDEMAGMSALLKRRLNIDISTTGQTMENLVFVFGQANKEAPELASKLAMMGQKFGNANNFIKQFNDMTGTLSKFGLPDMSKEFSRLYAIQEKTGTSMNSLVSSMETFSTFEGALNAASKLNAAFGSTIDGMEIMDKMMTEGPAESLLLLRQRLEESGIAFADMGYAQRRLLAESLNMSTQDLAGVMNQPFTELEEAVKKSDGSFEGLKDTMTSLTADTIDAATATEEQTRAQEKQALEMDVLNKLLHALDKQASSFAANNPIAAMFVSAAIQAGVFGATMWSMMGIMKTFSIARSVDNAKEMSENVAATASWHARMMAALKAKSVAAGGPGLGGGMGMMGILGAVGLAAGVGAGIGMLINKGFEANDKANWEAKFGKGPVQFDASGGSQGFSKDIPLFHVGTQPGGAQRSGLANLNSSERLNGALLGGFGGTDAYVGKGDVVDPNQPSAATPQEQVFNMQFQMPGGEVYTKQIKGIVDGELGKIRLV
tara:strand:+ start:103 stop:2439 length:2337 start_codon:yes stop_codon:yes gene_type:complete